MTAQKAEKKQPAPKIRTAKQRKIVTTLRNHPELSTRQVASMCDTDHAYVVQLRQRHNIIKENVTVFDTHQEEVILSLQDRLLAGITDADLQKTPVGTKILGFCQLFDKLRLLRDQSTNNITTIIQDVAALKALQNKG